jgi:hypothetical protein
MHSIAQIGQPVKVVPVNPPQIKSRIMEMLSSCTYKWFGRNTHFGHEEKRLCWPKRVKRECTADAFDLPIVSMFQGMENHRDIRPCLQVLLGMLQ